MQTSCANAILKYQSKTNWNRIDKMKDHEIDYSEIPELDDLFFKNAKLFIPSSKNNINPQINHNILSDK